MAFEIPAVMNTVWQVATELPQGESSSPVDAVPVGRHTTTAPPPHHGAALSQNSIH